MYFVFNSCSKYRGWSKNWAKIKIGVCLNHPEFVGGELSFQKLGSFLVGLSGGMLNFSWKPAQPKLLSWGQMCVLACRLELKWSQDKSICVCVLMWSGWGWSLGEARVQILILAELGTKNWVFWHYQIDKAVWYNLFVNLVNNWHCPSIRPHDSEICDSRLNEQSNHTAHGRLVLQVHLGSNTLEFSAIHR